MGLLTSFKNATEFAEKRTVRSFWYVTTMRILSSGLDLIALTLIWYTVNGVVEGKFRQVSMANLILIPEMVVSEALVVLFGLFTVMLFVGKSFFGLVTLRLMRQVTVEIEVSIANAVFEKNILGALGGADSARELLPRTQHALLMARSWVMGAIGSFSTLLAEGSLVLVLFAIMMIASPWSTLALLITLGGAASFLQFFLRKRIRRLSTKQRQSTLSWTANLSNALGVRTHLTISNRANSWIAGLREGVRSSSRAAAQITLLNAIPRYVLEFAVLMSVGAVIAGSFLLGDFSQNAAGAALVLAGAFRISSALLPIQGALNAMISSDVMGKAVRDNLEHMADRKIQRSSSLMLELESFLQEPTSKFLIITGPSGVGKTTSLLAALGDLMQSGALQKLKVGYAGQDPAILSGGLSRNLYLQFEDQPVEAQDELLGLAKSLDFELLLDRIVEKLGETSDSVTLSGGEKTKLEILRAHSNSPNVVILDEPTTGLDIKSSSNLAEFLRFSESRYVIITHDEKFASSLKPSHVVKIGDDV